MEHSNRAELVELGLSPTEAQVYLALLQGATLSASAIATATSLSRTAVYQILCSLSDKGLIESGAGYGSKFTVIAPERALPALIAREEEGLAQRKKVAETLSERLAALAEPAEAVTDEVIEVIRNPRAVAERFERLQIEAKRQIDVFVKAPLFVRSGNPAEEKPLRRGVRCRGLYERAVLDTPGIKPHLAQWIAKGEEVRVYNGELPHKLAIFDAEIVLMPLIRPHEQTKTVLIRHPQLAQTLTVAFNHFWEQSQPVAPIEKRKSFNLTTGRNGDQRLRRRKQSGSGRRPN